MRKFFLLVFIFLLIINTGLFSQELSESELDSRRFFGESLRLLFDGEKYEARAMLNQAMTGEIYITDIPIFWYYAAKLDLQLGMIDRAITALDNALLFSTVNEEANTLLNFIDNMKTFSISRPSTINFVNLEKVSGVDNSSERFFSPVDFEIINSNLYILDSKNHLVFKTDTQFEKWLKLDKNKSFYSIDSDKNLNRVYLSANDGIYYFDSYSSNVKKEIKVNDTFTATNLDRNIENELNVLIEGFPFVIYGVDNAGRLVGYDPYNNQIDLIGYNGEILQRKTFDHDYTFMDGALWLNSLYLLEYESSSIINFNILKNEIEEIIKLPKKTYFSLEVLPNGRILISSVEDGIEILDEENNLHLLSEVIGSFDNDNFRGRIKVENGMFIISDLKNNEIYLQRLEADSHNNLYILNLYGLNYDKNKRKVTLKVKISDVIGQKMEFLTKNIYVMDSGGRVPFNYYRQYSVTENYEYDINDLFQIHVPQINTDSNIITHGELNVELSPEKTIPFILSSSSLFHLVEGKEVNEDLSYLAFMSGGSIIDISQEKYLKDYLDNAYKPIDYLEYDLFPPIIPAINPVSVVLLLQENTLVDTLFYYTEGDSNE